MSKVTQAARGTEELVPGSAWCQKVNAFHHPGEMEIQPEAKERHLSQPDTLTMSLGWGQDMLCSDRSLTHTDAGETKELGGSHY